MLRFYMRTAKTYINYKFHLYSPFAVFFLITSKCNLNCKNCLVVNRWNPRNELETEEILSLIDDAASLGVSYFSVTGGEPLLRDDLEQIGLRIKDKDMVVSLSTNGTLINSVRARKLLKSFDYIRVSLDGFEDKHDKLRGKGSFKKTIKGIGNLISERDKGNQKIRIGITSLVNKLNYREIKEFFEAFKDKVDFINFQPIYGIDTIFSNPEFVRDWKEINDEKIGDLEEFIGNPSLEEGKRFCDAGKLYLIIDPEGNVHPCLPERNNPIGNLREKNLKEIWNSDEIINAREKAKNCIGCYSKCTTEISKIFRMNPIQIFLKFYRLKRTYRL